MDGKYIEIPQNISYIEYTSFSNNLPNKLYLSTPSSSSPHTLTLIPLYIHLLRLFTLLFLSPSPVISSITEIVPVIIVSSNRVKSIPSSLIIIYVKGSAYEQHQRKSRWFFFNKITFVVFSFNTVKI